MWNTRRMKPKIKIPVHAERCSTILHDSELRLPLWLVHPLSIIRVWHGYCLIFFVVEGSLSSSRLRKKRESSKLKPSGGTNLNSGVQSPAMKASEMVNCWTFVPGPSFYVVSIEHPGLLSSFWSQQNVWNDVYTKPQGYAILGGHNHSVDNESQPSSQPPHSKKNIQSFQSIVS